MRIIKMDSFHRAGKNSKILAPGTLMYHYAVEGTKEELDEYEAAKGANFSTVEEGIHKGKPIFFSSRSFAAKGESAEVRMDANGNFSAIQSLEEAEADQEKRNEKRAQDARLEKEISLKAKYASQYGLALA